MTNLTSALNFGALITLSCCNAVLQIAAVPSCSDGAAWGGRTCDAAGAIAEAEPRLLGFRLARRSGMERAADRDAACLAADFK